MAPSHDWAAHLMRFRRRVRTTRLRAHLLCGFALLAHATPTFAEGTDTPPQSPVLVDAVAVRYTAPELGGVSHPRVLTLRELTFFARVEALGSDGVAATDFVARYGKSAYERLIAEDLLATVEQERRAGNAADRASAATNRDAAGAQTRATGQDAATTVRGRLGRDPKRNTAQLESLLATARAELVVRIGGETQLQAALSADGLSDAELVARLRLRALAILYVDRNVKPLREPSEDELVRAFRSGNHPFRALRWEEARPRFLAYFVDDRFRQAATDYLQSARTRVKIAIPTPEMLMSTAERNRTER